MADRVNLDIETGISLKRLQELRTELERLNQEAIKFANTLGTAPSQHGAAQFFSTAGRIGEVQNQIAAITNSTMPGAGIQMQKIGTSGIANLVDVMAGMPMNARAGMYLSGFLQQGVIPSVMASPTVPGLPGIGGPMAYGSPAALGGLQVGAPMVPGLPGAINNPANPYAGAGAMGPASAIGMPGYNLNAYSMQRSMAMRQMYGLAAVSGSVYAGGMMSWQGGVDRAGGADPQGGWGMFGTGLGMAAGFAAGFITKNPAIGLGVGSAATALFGGLGSWFGANQANDMDMGSALHILNREMGPSSGLPRGIASRMKYLGSSMNPLGLPAGLRISNAQAASATAAMYESMVAGGLDPQAPGQRSYAGGSALFNRWLNFAQSALSAGNPLMGMLGAAGTAVAAYLSPKGTESAGEMYSRRLMSLYGKDWKQGMQQVAPVIGSMPETGGNVADMLTRFGASSTYRWMQLQNDSLEGSMNLESLMGVSANIRATERMAQLGGLQARGSGAATVRALGNQLNEIGALPGGSDSLAYASTSARRRDALMTAFQQTDAVNFGVPMAQAQGRLARMSLLPFNPGNVMGETLGVGRMASRQANLIDARKEAMRATGSLTEEAELQMTEQSEHYRTMGASAINTVSEGFLNRLPALSAGRPGFFGRANSFLMAAASIAGSPVRAFGALNGRQLRSQDDFYAGVGGAPAAWSRTQAFNNSGGGGGMSETNSLLKELIAAVKSGGSNSMRSGEAAGAVASALYGKRVGNNTGSAN